MIKSFIVSGSGGQGILSLGNILATIIMLNKFFVTLCSSYGAEIRGGAVNCEINMSDQEILCVQNNKVDFVIALNQASFDKFISKVKRNGTIIVNSSLAKIRKTREDINYIFVPLTEEAMKLGNIKIANSISLGILSKLLGCFSMENVKEAYAKILKGKDELVKKNLEGFLFGFNYLYEREFA